MQNFCTALIYANFPRNSTALYIRENHTLFCSELNQKLSTILENQHHQWPRCWWYLSHHESHLYLSALTASQSQRISSCVLYGSQAQAFSSSKCIFFYMNYFPLFLLFVQGGILYWFLLKYVCREVIYDKGS